MRWPFALLAGVSFGLTLYGVMKAEWGLWGLGMAGLIAAGSGQAVVDR